MTKEEIRNYLGTIPMFNETIPSIQELVIAAFDIGYEKGFDAGCAAERGIERLSKEDPAGNILPTHPEGESDAIEVHPLFGVLPKI